MKCKQRKHHKAVPEAANRKTWYPNVQNGREKADIIKTCTVEEVRVTIVSFGHIVVYVQKK